METNTQQPTTMAKTRISNIDALLPPIRCSARGGKAGLKYHRELSRATLTGSLMIRLSNVI